MINPAVRNSIRGSGRQAYPHQVARVLPRTGLLLYLGRPNLEAADVPIGDDTEIGDDTIIRWMFLLPADADIRAATGWISGAGNIFYDAAGDPVAVLASEIAAWSSINQWNVLFHLVSADTESGRLAIYAVDTPVEILNKALKVLREDQIDVSPSAFFNGMDFRLAAYTGGPTYELDHLGVLRSPGANRWAVRGMRLEWVEGPELVVNGMFNVDISSWTLTTGDGVASWVNGRLRASGGIGNSFYTQTITTVSGKRYKITYTPYNVSGTKFSVRVGGVFLSAATTDFNPVVTEFTATSTSTLIELIAYAEEVIEFDNVSVKELTPTYLNTDESGNPIVPSNPQKTVTYNTDWTAKTFAETFDKFDISDPLKAPGWLCEPVRTNYALNSATPVTHTTGTLTVGTYTLWQEGAGSITATAGTAIGTFGTASNGTPATITITTAGTVVLTASGTNTWVQVELGAFKTSRIYTTTTPMVRAATVASFPTAGKIPVNNFAIRMIVVPRASGQSAELFGSYIAADNYISLFTNATDIYFRKRKSAVSTEVNAVLANTVDVPIYIIITSSSSAGMQVSARAYSSSWGAFANGIANTSTGAKENAQIGLTYQLGALNSTAQFVGNISLFDCVPIPSGITDPMAWAKTHWGVA